MNEEEKYMQLCLNLAAKGFGNVAPNPMVGCIIVYNDVIIGEGYHQKYGEAHAEVNAINSVKDKSLLKYATLYVSLEPCAHFGKTPPCVDLIIRYQLKKVVIGTLDNHSLVFGKGVSKLKEAEIETVVGVLPEKCKQLNKRFFTFHEKKRPFIILKWAQTANGYLDNKRLLNDGRKPLKISNDEVDKLVHTWRSQEQAILIGTNTALLDNPKLNTRLVNGKNPMRIVIDKELKIPTNYFLLDNTSETIVFNEIREEIREKTKFILLEKTKLFQEQLLNKLFNINVQSIVVEGGKILLETFIKNNLWDEARIITSESEIKDGVKAPIVIGENMEEYVIENNSIQVVKNKNSN